MDNARRKEIEELSGGYDEPSFIPSEMAASKLSLFLDVDTRTINTLADKGVLSRKANGKFNTKESTQKYLAFAKRSRGNADLESAKVRVAEQTAAKLEMQNEISQGELVRASDVEARWTAIFTRVRAGVLAVPSRVAGRAGHFTAADLDIIDREIRDALQELSNGDA